MKRILLLTIILTITFSLSACGNKSNKDTIVIWHDKEEAIIDVLDHFIKQEEPDITVEFVRKESLTDTLKLVGNNANSAPEMFIFAHDKIGLFSEIGILEPMSNLIDTDILKEYEKLTVDAATYKDEIYQLPLYFETLLFMYNKDRISEESMPKTTDDLLDYMRQNTTSRRYAFVEQHSNAYYSAGWIHGFGGTILNEAGLPELNSENTIKALEYHRQFIEYMPKGQAEYATINTLFYEKKANSIIAGPWIVPEARNRGIDLGFAPMPIINETGEPISPYAGVQGVHVLKSAVQDESQKERVVKILNVFMSTDLAIELALASGVAPAKTEAYQNQDIVNDELVMAMKHASEASIPMPNLPEMDIMWLTTANMLIEINMNSVNIQSAVDQAQKESEDLIKIMRES